MNGTMPAMVNSVVGFGEISDAEGMTQMVVLGEVIQIALRDF